MTAAKHLVLDVSVIIDLWLKPNRAQAIEGLFAHPDDAGVCRWVSAASLPTLEFVAVRRLKEQGLDAEEARSLVRRLMTDLLSRVKVLSNWGYDQDDLYARARDFGDAQIAASARCLTAGQVCIVSSDANFDALGEIVVRAPERALEWLLQGDKSSPQKLHFIDLAAQQVALRPQVERNIEAVLRHGQYIMGPEVAELEGKLAAYTGAKHCVTVASGTEALLISLMALGIGPGDEVITTPFTFVATAEVIVLLGAKPVFVDVELDTGNINASLIEAKITPKTKAIMPVSLYGQPADMDEINTIAERHGKLAVIEDAAQSFGASYKGRKSCNLSTLGCTSFFPSKPLGCYGDGGAIFTNDDELAQACREIRVHGQSQRYVHTRVGVGGRMDTMQCAIVLAKLERFDWEVEQRLQIGQRYNQLVDKAGMGRIQQRPDRTSVFAQYTIVPHERDKLQDLAQDANIPTAVHYPVPLNEQPAYKDRCCIDCTPVAQLLAKRVMSLPMSIELDAASQQIIVNRLRVML